MDLKAAFRRAQEQEQAAAEDKTDSDNTLDIQEAFNMANAEFDGIRGIDGSPSPAPRPFRRQIKSNIPSRNFIDRKSSDLNTKLEGFDRSHQLTGAGAPRNGLFANNRIPSTAAETGYPLRNKTSDESLGRNPNRQMPDAWGTSPKNQEKVGGNRTRTENLPSTSTYQGEGGVDIPIPSIEYGNAIDDRPSESKPANRSPEKSINWHLDGDFTAGDLEISASPRITTRKTSSGLSHQMGTPISRRSRLSQIQERELEAARTSFPEDTPITRPVNHRLDEIRAREMEALSKRALASSRLDEIRIKNSEPRSESPELRKDPYKKPSEDGPAQSDADGQNAPRPSSNPESRGEPIHGTPILVFKNSGERTLDNVSNRGRTQEGNIKRGTLSGTNPYDSLPHLTRLISSSPQENVKAVEEDNDVPNPQNNDIKQPSEERKLTRSHFPQEERKVQNTGAKNPKDRPTVGFADLIRIPSSDSLEEKRTSMPTSEVDPTERITAELNLFAPLDNYSERGSIRAPSPVPSEPKDEETPRPAKIDPLTQPTPRVTGAYVDTPATVRVTREERGTPAAQGRTSGLSPTKNVLSPGRRSRAKSLKRPGSRSSSMPPTSRRSRSSSRRRRPLINTAKPPSVKDDILSILRANNIDDSTLENLDSILDRELDDQKLKELVNDTVLKVENDLDMKFSEMSDRERELEAYERMSKSLQTGLLGIRSAKKGIERLEDKVTHNGSKDDQPREPTAVSGAQPLAHSSLSLGEAAAVVIPIPRLYHRSPKFKLTTLGIITMLAAIWYALECAFCSLYGGPEYICTPAVPCDWSPNEPYFPYTMPFMLDEWATGGKGRALVWKAGEEIGDMFAEVSDWATNTDFTQFDERYMDVWQRKRHRRRLRKRALVPKWAEPPGYKARFPAWQAARAAQELAEELGEDESMSADEIAW